MPSKKHASASSSSVLLVIGILLIAANMRAPIIGVAPLFETIRDAFGLDTMAVGMLTTLPLLAFAFASPFCVVLARKYGLERSLFIALALIALGVIARPLGPVWTLFLGSAIIGIGIAIGNVLLPALLKRDFSGRIASVTSAYTLTMNATTALASAIVVPIAALSWAGWNWALAAFIVLPISAMVVWAPQLIRPSLPTTETASPPQGGKVWHSSLAWQVALFFGCNSLIAYTVTSWLPAVLTDTGYSPQMAGSFHGLSQLATAAPSLILAPLISRFRDQRGMAVSAALITALAIIGLLLAPELAPIWIVTFGLGSGSTFILALTFVGLRAGNVWQAGALSGMAQTIGYTMAAVGPPLIGLIHDLSGNWSVPLAVCVVICLVMACVGYGAGRSIQID